MPIVVRRRPMTATTPPTTPLSAPPALPKPATRGSRLSDAVRALAPTIEKLKQEGHYGNAEIAKRLNELGFKAPSGGPFTRETTRRLQRHIKELGLGSGPRSVSLALTSRHVKKRENKMRRLLNEVDQLVAQQKRDNPDWKESRPWLGWWKRSDH